MISRKFEVFQTVLQYGNLTKAAAALNLTPSAVSHAIRELEEELDVMLFIRNKKGVVLSLEGRHILPYIQDVIAASELLLQESAQIRGSLSGTVNFSAPSFISETILPDIMLQIHSAYKNIGLSLYESSIPSIAHMLDDNMIDIVFTPSLLPEKYVKIAAIRDHLVCLAPADYPLPVDRPLKLLDLMKMNLIVGNLNYHPIVKKYIETNHLAINSFFNVENQYIIRRLIANHFGCTLEPSISSYDPDFGIKRYEIAGDTDFLIHIGVSAQYYDASATSTVRKFILEYLKIHGFNMI